MRGERLLGVRQRVRGACEVALSECRLGKYLLLCSQDTLLLRESTIAIIDAHLHRTVLQRRIVEQNAVAPDRFRLATQRSTEGQHRILGCRIGERCEVRGECRQVSREGCQLLTTESCRLAEDGELGCGADRSLLRLAERCRCILTEAHDLIGCVTEDHLSLRQCFTHVGECVNRRLRERCDSGSSGSEPGRLGEVLHRPIALLCALSECVTDLLASLVCLLANLGELVAVDRGQCPVGILRGGDELGADLVASLLHFDDSALQGTVDRLREQPLKLGDIGDDLYGCVAERHSRQSTPT